MKSIYWTSLAMLCTSFKLNNIAIATEIKIIITAASMHNINIKTIQSNTFFNMTILLNFNFSLLRSETSSPVLLFLTNFISKLCIWDFCITLSIHIFIYNFLIWILLCCVFAVAGTRHFFYQLKLLRHS